MKCKLRWPRNGFDMVTGELPKGPRDRYSGFRQRFERNPRIDDVRILIE